MYDWERKFNHENEERERLYLIKETSRGYYVKKYDHPNERLTYLSKKEAFKEWGSSSRSDKNYHEFWVKRDVVKTKIDSIMHPDYSDGGRTLIGLFGALRKKAECKRRKCRWHQYGRESYCGFGEDANWGCETCNKDFVVCMDYYSPAYDNSGKVVSDVRWGKIATLKAYRDKHRQYRSGLGGCTDTPLSVGR